MHIPDGFLEPKVWVPLTAVSGLAVIAASKMISRKIDERMVPLMGVLAAFVFAAQMVNFPIGGGTSGHLMGGVLIAVIVGPYGAVVIMATILILQALLFQDGGITALGANIFNMGIVGAGGGYVAFKALNGTTGSFKFSIFVSSWLSVVLAAGAAAAQLSLSGVIPLAVSLPAMAGVHAIIGIGEGVITIAALLLVNKVNSEAVYVAQRNDAGIKRGVWKWLAASLAVAILLAPLASKLPDGLEKIAERLGFLHMEATRLSSPPFSDYQIPGLSGGVSTALAGAVGVLMAFGAAYIIIRILHRKRKEGK